MKQTFLKICSLLMAMTFLIGCSDSANLQTPESTETTHATTETTASSVFETTESTTQSTQASVSVIETTTLSDTTTTTTDTTTSETTTTTTSATTSTTTAQTTVSTTTQEPPISSDSMTQSTESTQSSVITTTTTAMTTTAALPDVSAAIQKMDKLVNGRSRGSAVLLYSLELDQRLYQHDEEWMILGASLIKLPYVYFCCQQIENGVKSADEVMTYTKDFYHGGAGIIRKSAYGTKYKISTLIDYALRYSDNVAYDMLVYAFGIDGFNAMIKDWGFGVRISQYTRFPQVNAVFMKYCMHKMYLQRNNSTIWQTAWTALNESTGNYARAEIDENANVAIKYGLVETSYHEVIFVDGAHPYILVILTATKNYTKDQTFVKKVVNCAEEIIAGTFA